MEADQFSSAHLIDYCHCQLFWSYCQPCEFPGFEVTVHLVILDIDGFLSFHFVLSRWIGCPIFSSSTAYLTALLCHMRGYLIALLCFTLPYERRGDVNVVFNSIQGCLQLLLYQLKIRMDFFLIYWWSKFLMCRWAYIDQLQSLHIIVGLHWS